MSIGVARLAWSLGTLTVASSIAASAYIRHNNQFRQTDISAMKNAQQIQMGNGLGLCLLGTRRSALMFLPLTFLASGTVMFSGVIFYSRIYKDAQYNWMVPYGGGASILGWFVMAAC